jgi:hypothetical protein
MIDWDVDAWHIGRGYRVEKRHNSRVFVRGMKARCEYRAPDPQTGSDVYSAGLYDVDDISTTGARLKLGGPAPLNAPVLVEIMVPGEGAFMTTALVVWRKRDASVGLWFDNLDSADRRMLEEFVKARKGRHIAPLSVV